MKQILLAGCIISLTVTGLHADVLVLKNGKRVVIQGTYETKGKFVVCTSESGELIQLPLAALDLEQSKVATAEAAAAAAAKAAEEAKPKPKKEAKGLAEVLGESIPAQKKTERTVFFSNDGLENYAQTHEPVSNDSVAADGTNSGSAAGADTAGSSDMAGIEVETPELVVPEVKLPDVDELSDPAKIAKTRKETQAAHSDTSKEVKQLNEDIKKLEESREGALEASAFADDTDQPFVQDALEKTEEALANKKKERDEKAADLKNLEKNAKKKGVKIKKDDQDESSSDTEGSTDRADRYDENGKRKPIE